MKTERPLSPRLRYALERIAFTCRVMETPEREGSTAQRTENRYTRYLEKRGLIRATNDTFALRVFMTAEGWQVIGDIGRATAARQGEAMERLGLTEPGRASWLGRRWSFDKDTWPDPRYR
jgi:hypothetical protein